MKRNETRIKALERARGEAAPVVIWDGFPLPPGTKAGRPIIKVRWMKSPNEILAYRDPSIPNESNAQ